MRRKSGLHITHTTAKAATGLIAVLSLLLGGCRQRAGIIEADSSSPGSMRRHAELLPAAMEGTKFDRMVYNTDIRRASYYLFIEEVDSASVDLDSLQEGLRAKVIDNIRTIPDMLEMAADGVLITYRFMDCNGIMFFEQQVQPKIYRSFH